MARANSSTAAPRPPARALWASAGYTDITQPYSNPNDYVHYPVARHNGVFNVLYCDGHASALTQNDLGDALFLANAQTWDPSLQ